MNYATIKKNDIANGSGVRVSLFVSGCRHRCKNCFNREAWDFDFGKLFTKETETEIFAALDHAYVRGFSLLGGEPFEPENRAELTVLLKKIRERFPEKDVWCYTGFSAEELLDGSLGVDAGNMLKYVDVLVDGKFVESLKDLSLLFRGSSNQRIIDVKKSLACGKAVLLAGRWERIPGGTNIEDA